MLTVFHYSLRKAEAHGVLNVVEDITLTFRSTTELKHRPNMLVGEENTEQAENKSEKGQALQYRDHQLYNY